MKNRKQINKLLILLIAIVVFAVIVVVVFKSNGSKRLQESSSTQSIEEPASTTAEPNKPSSSLADPNTPVSSGEDGAQAKGRYAAYSAGNRSAQGYDTNIVFFHAGWCPECRAFKQAIQSDEIPNGVQILEADYDTSGELKKQYGVTLQSTFVRVDDDGDLQKKWGGYGQNKSLDTIISNLQ